MNSDAAEMIIMIVFLESVIYEGDRMKTSTMIFDFGCVTMLGTMDIIFDLELEQLEHVCSQCQLVLQEPASSKSAISF